MIIYCTSCGINWARLWSFQGDGDDELESCPNCGTDMFLEDGNDIEAFIKCPFTGIITNARTGDVYGVRPVSTEKPRIRIVVGKPVKPSYEEREALEEKAIQAYITSGRREDYFSTLRKQKS